MLSNAVRLPSACGVKVRLIKQDDPTGILDVQLFVSEKSPGFEPAKVMPETMSGAVPSGKFSRVTGRGLDAPKAVSGSSSCWLGRICGSGEGFRDAAEMVTVSVGALLSRVSIPSNIPAEVGTKLIVTLQGAIGARG